jgi:uncharacterized protein (TIGR00255 family)
MIISMTGYGKSVKHLDDKKITVEIRTLNSKNLDLNIRIGSTLKELELPLRQQVAKSLMRGKVDVSVYLENTGTSNSTQLNLPVIESYMKQLEVLDGINGSNDANRMHLLDVVSRFPDVFDSQTEELSASDKKETLKVISEGLAEVQKFRAEEGATLKAEFDLRITNIKSLLDEVISIDVGRLSDVRARLEKAVQELKERVDENRFEQELIYYLEKYDITEEKVRLKTHLDYFIETMELPTSQGKKLGFISQEIGREVNTIGSKANHAVMQQLVVQMKDELEKVKEQLLNVL